MLRLSVFLAVAVIAHAWPVVYTDDTSPKTPTDSRLEELEQAVINLIEEQRGWHPHVSQRPDGDIIKAFNKACQTEHDDFIARRKAEEVQRAKEEAELRIKRYKQMREACNKYYTAENWITETAWKECCAVSSPDRPNNIGCDLDEGTPGHYYIAMSGFIKGRGILG